MHFATINKHTPRMYRVRGSGVHVRRTGGELMLEMLVAFSLISITLVVVVGAFVATQRANRSASAQAELSQALLFFLEDMTREVWLSDHFDNEPPSGSGWCNGVLYMRRVEGVNNQEADEVCYLLSPSDGRISKQVKPPSGPQTDLFITPSSVEVSGFGVMMTGDDKGNQTHPTKLLVNLTASQKEDADTVAPLNLQTTITAHFVTQEGTP